MGTGSWPALVGREREKGFSGGSGWAIRAEALREPIHRLCVLYFPTRSGAAMLQGFFTLYYLVKNVRPSKVFFKFCKEPDRFCIYHKTTPNALWQCVSFLKQTDLHCDLSPVEYGYGCGDFF